MSAPKPLHIFRAGRQTTNRGVSLDFSEGDLAACAAAYDPALHEAPIVVGHPKADGPAYGWVKSLAVDANGLQAEATQVDAQFAELVDAGRYKKISASFYAPDAPANPVPGIYYLRHVGFLGAEPPAVKGLKPVEFAESEPGVLEFAEWDDQVNAGMWRQLRDWFIGKFGQDEADKAIPGWDVSTLEREAQKPSADDIAPSTSFTETHPSEPTVTPEQAAALEAKNLALQAELDTIKAAKRTAEFGEFLSGLVKDGKVLPVEQAGLLAFMEALPADQVLEFSESGAKVSKPQADFLKSFLSNLPKRVEFSEVAGGAVPAEASDDSRAISDKAAALQAALKSSGQDISFAEAVQRVVQAK